MQDFFLFIIFFNGKSLLVEKAATAGLCCGRTPKKKGQSCSAPFRWCQQENPHCSSWQSEGVSAMRDQNHSYCFQTMGPSEYNRFCLKGTGTEKIHFPDFMGMALYCKLKNLSWLSAPLKQPEVSLPVTSETIELTALTAEGVTCSGASSTLIWIRGSCNSLMVGQYSNGGGTSWGGHQVTATTPWWDGSCQRGSGGSTN